MPRHHARSVIAKIDTFAPAKTGYLGAMRIGLRLAALGVLVVTLGLWFFGGPNLGWTKTRVAVPVKDEITGLEGVRWENHFLPGMDFVGAGMAAAGVLVAVSFVVRQDATPAGRS